MTSTSLEAPSGERFKLCPTCGYATPASRNRCHHCWNDVADATLLDPIEAERRLAREEALEAARARAEVQHRQQVRAIRLSGVVLLLGLVAWWGYRGFIYEPPPVPLPSSTERAVAFGADAWPTAGGDLGATRNTVAAPALEGDVAWTADMRSGLAVTPVSDGDQLYVALLDGRILAFDVESGDQVWAHQLQNFPFAAPTVAGDLLYVPERQGQLLTLDTASGELAYESVATQSSFGTSPLVSDGMAYVFGTGELNGFDAETGELLWQVRIPSNWAFVTPVLSGRYLAVATGDRTLVFDRFSGQETYFYEFERAHPFSITAADGFIYALSTRFGAALNIEARRPWWEGMRAVWSQFWIWGMAPSVPPPPSEWVTARPPSDGYPAAVGSDLIFLGSANGDLRALNRTTGLYEWQVSVDPIMTAPLVTPAGVLITHADRVTLYAPDDGSVLAERRFEDSRLDDVIVTSRGTFVFTADGTLLALR